MIEVLKRLASVPVIFTNLDALGTFFWKKSSSALYFDKRIEIDKSLQQHQRIAVLSHEVGHALCFEKDCKCFEGRDIIQREFHAHKYALKFLLKYKQKKALKWMMKDIIERSHDNPFFEKPLKRLMKLKLWQKCLDYIGEPK